MKVTSNEGHHHLIFHISYSRWPADPVYQSFLTGTCPFVTVRTAGPLAPVLAQHKMWNRDSWGVPVLGWGWAHGTTPFHRPTHLFQKNTDRDWYMEPCPKGRFTPRGRPSWEAVGLNGQTLLRVQTNGLNLVDGILGIGAFGWAQCEASKGTGQAHSPNLGPWTPTVSQLGWSECEASKGQVQILKEEGACHFIHCRQK
jgi:hypothetical protein